MKRIKFLSVFILSLAVFSILLKSCKNQNDAINIGVILPLTGPAALIGEQHKAGLDVALDKYNSGNPKKKINLIYEDDSADPKKAVTAANKLITLSKVDLIISVMTASSMAILPVTETNKKILFANCGHPTINKMGKMVFRNFPSSRQEVQEMVPYLINNKKYKNIGLLYINDAFGKAAEELIGSLVNSQQGTIAFSYPYEPKGIDFKNLIAKILQENVDALYIYGYGDATATLLNQLREYKYSRQIVGNYNFSGPPLTSLSKTSLNSTFFTAPDFTIYSKNNNADQFINSFRAKTSKDPFWNAAIEYDALLIIGDAINRSNGSLDSLQIVLSEVKEFDGVVGRYNLVGSEWISPLTIKTFINDTLSLIYQP